MSTTTAVSGAVEITRSVPGRVDTAPSVQGLRFSEWLQKPEIAKTFNAVVDTPSHDVLRRTEDVLAAGGHLSTRELLLYQVRVNRFAARVELLSKTVESGVAAVRRFQNGG